MIAFTLSLTPALLISGPFLSDLLVSVSSICFLIYVFKNRLYYFINQKPLLIFFIFCLYCILVSIFSSRNILMSFESSLFYFRIGIFACLIWYLIEQDKKLLNFFYYSIIICFSILIIDSYLQYFFNISITGAYMENKGKYMLGDSNRISSLFGDELIMGSYLSRLFPLLFALFILKNKNKAEVYLMAIFFILCSGVIYISGGRAAFFTHLLSLVFILILIKNHKKLRLLLVLGFLIATCILSLNNDQLVKRMIKMPLNSIQNTIFTSHHDSILRTAYKMFQDKPLFGQGPKMFRVLCKEKKFSTGVAPCATHPHNFYIQLLAETGLIGFSFLFSLFVYVLFCSFCQIKKIIFRQESYLTDYQVCLLAGILITVWPFTTNGNFFNNWLAICYSLPVGFYLHSIYGKNKEEVLKN